MRKSGYLHLLQVLFESFGHNPPLKTRMYAASAYGLLSQSLQILFSFKFDLINIVVCDADGV